MRTKKDVLLKTAVDLGMDLKEVEDIYEAMPKALYEMVASQDNFVFVHIPSIGSLVYSRTEHKRKNLLTGVKARPKGSTEKFLVVDDAHRRHRESRIKEILTGDTRYQGFKYIKNSNPYSQKKVIRFYGLESSKNPYKTLEELEAYQEKIFYEEDIRFRK